MSFFAILFALLIEQARPLARSNPMHAGLRAWALSVNRNFDAGSPQHAWVAWALGVLLPPLAVLGVYWALLHFIGWPLALVWNVAVLYVTLGFRQFSHHFTGIRDALEEGDAAGARARLAQWKQVDASELPRSEVVRHVIEYSVIAAHRHVFGVLAWYSVCAALGLGPAGAVLYRLAEFVARYWAPHTATAHPASSALQAVAAQAWTVIDWLPARPAAVWFSGGGRLGGGNQGWRFHAQRFPSDNDGVILAATAGAINVRLGGEALRKASADAYVTPGFEAGAELGDSDSTPGREPEVGHLRSVVGLVWRSVVVWMLLLALLTLARLLG